METKYQKVRKSLKYSTMDGMFNAMKIGFGESFFQAFATLFKATDFQLGLLGSLPIALGSIAQIWSSKLVKIFNSRRKFILFSVIFEALMYIPIASVFFFGELKVFHLIFFVCLYWIFGTIAVPAWSSWMGDLVNEHERGSYFGKRNKIAGFASFFAMLAGGYILQIFADGLVSRYIGFTIIFILAFASRIFSYSYLSKQYEPEYSLFPEKYFSFIDFIRLARFTNYGKFVLYLSSMNFAVYIAAPFFTAYMLYELNLSYMEFTIITAASLIVKFIAMPIWGRASDRFGTKKVLSLASFLMPLTPLLWIFSSNFWYLIAIQAYSGFVWAGFEISSFSFIFDNTTPQKRTRCIAYYNVLNGIAVFLGAISGAFVIKYSEIIWSKYYLVFLLSAVLRYGSSLGFIPHLKEERRVEHISYKNLLLSVLTTMPTMGIIHHLIPIRKR